MIRFGVAVRLLGKGAPGLPVPHCNLSLGLLWLHEVIAFLARRSIACYRLPDPFSTVLELNRSDDLQQELHANHRLVEQVRMQISTRAVRLSMHMAPALGPAIADHASATRLLAAITCRVVLLNAFGSKDATVVLHLGGNSTEPAVLERAARRLEQLPAAIREHVAIELDQQHGGLLPLLKLHHMCGVPIIWDLLHHQINNPDQIPLETALALALATWPTHRRPKIHLSTQRTEAHLLPGEHGAPMRVIAPLAGQHADFLNPHEVATVLQAARALPGFDAMLEAKAADLALARLREDLLRYRLVPASRIG